MNRELLESAGINVEEGLNRFAKNENLYTKFLKNFSGDPNFEESKAAFAAKDYQKVLFNIHALKGISGNLSIKPLFTCASELVNELRKTPIDEEKIAQLYEEVSKLYDQSVEVIDKSF